MCSIILHVGEDGIFIAANRDEITTRPWEPPAEYWPGITGGRDTLAGGTWAALNQHGVFTAVLNREGTLGPAPGKRSRGELPLFALHFETASEAALSLSTLDAGLYRAFNLVIADRFAAFLLRGLGHGVPASAELPEGVTMITSGEPNDTLMPRIARHLPRFRTTPPAEWGGLLADSSGAPEERLNIPPRPDGFGTVCATLVALPREGQATQSFAPGPPDKAAFQPVA